MAEPLRSPMLLPLLLALRRWDHGRAPLSCCALLLHEIPARLLQFSSSCRSVVFMCPVCPHCTCIASGNIPERILPVRSGGFAPAPAHKKREVPSHRSQRIYGPRTDPDPDVKFREGMC